MSLPEQARFATPARSPKTETDHQQNWAALEERLDRQPVFHEYMVVDENGFTSFSSGTANETGITIATFEKFFDWTDITIKLTVGMFTGTVGVEANFVAYIYKLNGAFPTFVQSVTLTRFYFNIGMANVHVSVSGAGRAFYLPAGSYQIKLMGYNAAGAGSVFSNSDDYTVFCAQETIPMSPRLD